MGTNDGRKRTCVRYTMSELNDTEKKDDMVGEEDSSFVDDEEDGCGRRVRSRR